MVAIDNNDMVQNIQNMRQGLDQALRDAASHGAIEGVQDCISRGANLNAADDFGGNALIYAAKNGHTNVVRYLLDNGAAVNYSIPENHLTALYCATSYNHAQTVAALLEKGADVTSWRRDNYEMGPVLIAIERGYTEILGLFKQHGVNFKEKADNFSTHLHYAAAINAEGNSVRFLLNSGLSVDLKDSNNNTPLLLAVQQGCYTEPNIKIFFENGADINARNKHGFTPLHLAIAAGNLERTQFILSLGLADLRVAVPSWAINSIAADVNAKDNEGNTPLHLASKLGYLEIAKILIACGADVSARNNFNESTLDVAVDSQFQEDLDAYIKELEINKLWELTKKNRNKQDRNKIDYDNMIQWLPEELKDSIVTFFTLPRNRNFQPPENHNGFHR